MKKIIIFLLVIIMLVSALPVSANNDYWPAQAAYNDARSKNDDAALVRAVDMICDVYENEDSETAHNRMRTPCHEAALAYERMGMYPEAGKAYTRALESAEWLYNNSEDPAVRAANAEFIRHYKRVLPYFTTEPQVYAATYESDSVPYYGAKNEPKMGTYAGMCDVFLDGKQSAMLLYAGFARESFSDYEYYLPDTGRTYYLEAAWNVVEENEAMLDEITSGKHDGYIKDELQYLNEYAGDNRNCKMLLRFGAEMNVWKPLDACGSDESKIKAFADKYIAAYRHVAELTHKYAPEIALVYSPVDYGQWYTTPETFYPGDEYVDFVGMSTYYNKHKADENKVGSKSDMLWGRGLYMDPVIRVREIIDLAEAHEKPVIISECGFSFASADGVQSEEHAKEKLYEFYTYINMVYPQIKIINLFNNNFANTEYRIYENPINDSADRVSTGLRDVYNKVISENEAIASTLRGAEPKSYIKLEDYNSRTNALKLYTYVPYPNPGSDTVVYTLNGKEYKRSTSIPHMAELRAEDLEEGVNKLTVEITSANTKVTKTYLVCLDDEMDIDVRLTKMSDVTGDEKYANEIGLAMHRGLISGTSPKTMSPSANTTRAQLVTILFRYSGSPYSGDTSAFTDLKADWYKAPVVWASKNGVVNGTSPTTFAPDNNVTLQDMAVILYRYSGKFFYDEGEVGSLEGISDADKVAGYAKDALAWAYSNKLIEAETDGGKLYINPTAQATRSQVACALVRLGDMIGMY